MRRAAAGDSGFEVPVGFGLRLRTLRRRSGLRQVDVALLMGGGRSQALVSQLESGRLKNPTLGLVVEYLRAVRARFSEISDLLDKLTAKLPSGEKAAEAAVELAGAEFGVEACRTVRRYDRKLALKRAVSGRRPEPVAKRARSADGSWLWPMLADAGWRGCSGSN
ncbi:MAG: helix-turn-helix domain-containing protein [candidate division WOR-3 bacterium]